MTGVVFFNTNFLRFFLFSYPMHTRVDPDAYVQTNKRAHTLSLQQQLLYYTRRSERRACENRIAEIQWRHGFVFHVGPRVAKRMLRGCTERAGGEWLMGALAGFSQTPWRV